jgi:hypothetical protein
MHADFDVKRPLSLPAVVGDLSELSVPLLQVEPANPYSLFRT